MKSRFGLFLIGLLIACTTKAQTQSQLDSLIRAYKKDPNQLETLSRLSQVYEFFNSDSALHYAHLLIKKSNNNPEYKARAYMSIANNHLTGNNFEKAVEYYEMAIEICDNVTGLKFDKAVYTQALAQAHLNFGNAKKAIDLYNKSLDFFLANKEEKQAEQFLASIYGGLGDSYRLIGLYDLAIENLLEAIQYSKKVNDPINLAITYNGLAVVYSNRKDIKKGINYNDLALKEFKNNHYPLGEATVLLNQAENYFKLGEIDKSLSFLKESEEILNSINTTYNLGEVYTLYGEIYRKLGNLQLSETYFNKAIEIHTQSGASQYLGTSLLELARTQLALGNEKDSKINTEKAIQIFKQNDSPKELSEALNFSLAQKLKAYPDLKEEFNAFIEAHERYLNLEEQNNIIAHEIKFETAEKEKQIALQELKIKNETYKRNIAIGLTISILMISIGLFLWLRSRNKHQAFKAKTSLYQLQMSINQMQLNELNQKLDPHEIKNLLASIAPEIQEKAPESYKRMLQLFKITKASLQTTSLTEDLNSQIDQATAYLNLMQNAVFEPFSFNIDNQLHDQNPEIPRLLLKNMVENSIKHGIKGKNDGGHIAVRIFDKNNFIQIDIDDTGKGRNLEQISEGGIGISTYRTIFETLNKKNNEKADIKIIDKEVGTRLEISIPKNYQYS